MDAALQEYQVLRKTNADAVADLALQNFVEMRDLVGDPAFLHRKHVEHDLAEMYPDRFRSQYELVSFSNEPYRYAWDQGARNGALLDYLIDNKLEDRLGDRAMLEPLFDKFL
jgi:kynurenine 3-monooxygenase